MPYIGVIAAVIARGEPAVFCRQVRFIHRNPGRFHHRKA